MVLAYLTVGERIWEHLRSLHLDDYDAKESWPPEATQDGIASAVGISRAHVSLELTKLVARGRVLALRAHVLNKRSVRRVYRAVENPVILLSNEQGQDLQAVPGQIVELKVVVMRCAHCGNQNRVVLT